MPFWIKRHGKEQAEQMEDAQRGNVSDYNNRPSLRNKEGGVVRQFCVNGTAKATGREVSL